MRHSIAFLLSLLLLPAAASADTQSYTGSLDPANPNDVFLATFSIAAPSNVVIQSWGYGGSAGAPGGTNAAGTVISPGGFDTYLSLFLGTGPTATFLDSNDDGGCGPASPDPVCEDSRLSETGLAAGDYTVALTLPNNFSIAENYGYGTLGDGFIGLQGDYYDYASGEVRTSNFAFDITSDTPLGSAGTTDPTNPAPPTAATPEPSSLALLASGLLLGTVLLGRNRLKLAGRPWAMAFGRCSAAFLSLAILSALGATRAHAETYLFDFHFDQLTYNDPNYPAYDGQIYPAADIFYTGSLPAAGPSGPAASLTYFSGSLDGYAPAQLTGFVDGSIVSYQAWSPTSLNGSVVGIYFLFDTPTGPGVYPSVASIADSSNDGAGRGVQQPVGQGDPQPVGPIEFEYAPGSVTITEGVPSPAPNPQASRCSAQASSLPQEWCVAVCSHECPKKLSIPSYRFSLQGENYADSCTPHPARGSRRPHPLRRHSGLRPEACPHPECR